MGYSIQRAKTSSVKEDNTHSEALYERISKQIHSARNRIIRSVNHEMVYAYWHIGKEIVEEELNGRERADYGSKLLARLSKRLTQDFGRGFNLTNLKHMRSFYLAYRTKDENDIGHTVCDQSEQYPNFNDNLCWSHYRSLIKVKVPTIRAFYEKETSKNAWSVRELERQINSMLFERLAKSRNKEEVLRLSRHGQVIQQPEDIIKDPVILEFLNIPESPSLIESELESALVSNLHKFLIEMGKGFAFVSRQQRLTLDGDHFYVDLVFYHTLLKCYILIDIKCQKLSHADLGQMQLYVNYYDQERLDTGDNPTIGLILCTDKNDAMVKYTLGEKGKQIFASRYQLHLPTERELICELKREIEEYNNNIPG